MLKYTHTFNIQVADSIKKMGKNRCLVFLNDLVLFCSVILSL